MPIIAIAFIIFSIFRISTIIYSKRNEKRLKSNGATEYGILNSKIMAIAHTVYYLACITEAVIRNTSFDKITIIGIGLVVFSYVMLVIVIMSLKEIWTVKLIIAKYHQINRNILFKYIRHPNYFLNIIPELIGIGLLCKAWIVMLFGLPVYFVILLVRIVQEENAMKKMKSR